MKQYLRDILITLAIGIALTIPFEVFYSHKSNMMTYQYDYLEQHPDRIKTLIMGHSQSAYGINPYAMGDSTFNLAISGRIIHFDALLLKKYIDRMTNLKAVIYPMHYAFSGGCRFFNDDYNQHHIIFTHARFMDLPNDRYPIRSALSFSTVLSNHFDWKNYADTSATIDSMGYTKMTGCNDWFASDLMQQEGQAEFTDDLTEMARLCQAHGVRLIVVTFPLKARAQEQTTSEGIQNMHDVIAEVRQHYPIEYHNYMCDTLFASDSLYFDCTHFNHTGATAFAKRIKADFSL